MKVDIGIIGALSEEVSGLIARLENDEVETVSGIEFHSGLLEGRRVAIARCGVGKVFAAICAEAMIIKYSPSLIVNTGVGGAIASDISATDTVIATSLVQHDMDTSAIGDPVGLISGLNMVYIPADKALCDTLAAASETQGLHTVVGTVASGDLFVAKDEDKARIKDQFNAAACEMEGASIGQVAYTNGVPFAVLRAISDGGDGMEFSEFAPLAATRSVKVTREFVKRLGE